MFFVGRDVAETGTAPNYGNLSDLFWPFDVACDVLMVIYGVFIWFHMFMVYVEKSVDLPHLFLPHLTFCFGCCLVRPQHRHRHPPRVGGCQALLSRRRIFSPSSGCCSWGLIQLQAMGICFLALFRIVNHRGRHFEDWWWNVMNSWWSDDWWFVIWWSSNLVCSL